MFTVNLTTSSANPLRNTSQPFIYLVIPSFIHPLIYSFIYLFIYSFIRESIYLFIMHQSNNIICLRNTSLDSQLFIYLWIYQLFNSSIHLIIHLFMLKFIYSSLNSPIQYVNHWFILSSLSFINLFICSLLLSTKKSEIFSFRKNCRHNSQMIKCLNRKLKYDNHHY